MPKRFALTCPECGARFEPKSLRQLFCSSTHQKAYSNRELGRGFAILGLARAWRSARHATEAADKGAGSEAFRELCRQLDAINTEDREAGRANPLKLYRRRKASGVID